VKRFEASTCSEFQMTLKQQVAESHRADVNEWLDLNAPAMAFVILFFIGALIALAGRFGK
tara:strand:- start:232 stop:411 length:180 start_codon:yes stop_codon:yes gene_type:complete